MFYEMEAASSSVYQGECDSSSLQTREEDEEEGDEEGRAVEGPPTRPPRSKVSTSRSVKSGSKRGEPVSVLEDVLVGHELGDRPLLADDELDNDELRLASMTASGDPSSSTSSSSSASGSMAGPAGKGAATVRSAGLFSSVALPFRRRIEERKEVKDKPNPLRLANDPDPANPQNRPAAEDVFALAPFKLPPKVNFINVTVLHELEFLLLNN